MLVDDDTFRRLCRARDYLASTIDTRITLINAAQPACLSPFHFHRLFARAFGETPHDFVRRLRLERARLLLAAGNLPVTDVCLAVGYESVGSFSTLFRNSCGMSPQEYRRSLRRFYSVPEVPPHRFIPTCFLRQYYGLRIH